MLRKLPILLFLLLLMVSCRDKGYALLTVMTDQKDMILIAEYFNASQDRIRLVLTYDDYISYDDVIRDKPDLVIGKDLNNPLFIEGFSPVTPEKGIYPVLLRNGNAEGVTTLLPLAFDLPVIVYRRGEAALPFMMDGEDLKREGSARNREKESLFTHMGFSPLWNSDFLYWYLSSQNIRFYGEGVFQYDQEKLTEGIDSIRDWVSESNVSLEREKSFSDKYRYIPDYKLLQKGLIDFVPMMFSEYSALPGKETVSLTYSWFGNGERITPLNGVFAGIPLDSDRKKEGEEFLAWLLSEKGQKDLIRYKGIVSPGFALFDKFSSRESINRLFLPDAFPGKLNDRIFLSEQIGGLPWEPENWSAIRQQVLAPWLEDILWDNGVLPLSSYYKEWQLQFID
ncbi:MAG: hypothetical protein JXA95_14335 [Spirochaetales bacterium]|nr:hypothetical protein [Spirochaetales bacterium]